MWNLEVEWARFGRVGFGSYRTETHRLRPRSLSVRRTATRWRCSFRWDTRSVRRHTCVQRTLRDQRGKEQEVD